jgi:regulatory protein
MLGPKLQADQAGDEGRARATALHLLAIREHASAEIREKLLRKGFAAAIADRVVQSLRDSHQLSDNRYAESFVRQHAARGQGPVRIRASLCEVGIQAELIDEYLDGADANWGRLAHSVRVRKFGTAAPANFRERAKQARFLQYRGFTHEQIRAALGGDWDVDLDPDSEI